MDVVEFVRRFNPITDQVFMNFILVLVEEVYLHLESFCLHGIICLIDLSNIYTRWIEYPFFLLYIFFL